MKILLVFLAERVVAVTTVTDRQLGRGKKTGESMTIGSLHVSYVHSDHGEDDPFLTVLAEDDFHQSEASLIREGWKPVEEGQAKRIMAIFPS